MWGSCFWFSIPPPPPPPPPPPHTPSFTHNFVTHLSLAGVELGDIHLCFTWQAWHLATHTFVLRGRRGTYRALGWLWWRAWTGLVAAAPFFAWQALHTVTSTFVSRGRRDTWRHLPAFGVAGVVQVALGGALGRRWSPLVARGAAPLFAYQAWHKVTFTFVSKAGVAFVAITWQAWHLETSTCVWRGRRGTCCTWWRAWSPLVAVGRPGRRATFCVAGVAHSTWWRALPAFGVAGVALVALGGALGRRWSPLVARGAAPLCVAGMAQGDIHLHFTWQVRHLLTLRFTWQAWYLATSTEGSPETYAVITRVIT